MPWNPGDAVVLRETHEGRVWRANAVRVVEDGRDRTVLWSPRGTPAKYALGADGKELRLPTAEWTLADRYGKQDALALYRPGARHSVWIYRHEDGSLAYWYVNFEEPLRRTEVGFDYRDEKLDLVVQPDGTWRWKDEDELEEAARLGLVDADAVWAEARRVLAAPTWPTGWEGWRPDPGWSPPALRGGWDAV